MHSQDWLEKRAVVLKLAMGLRRGLNPPHGKCDVAVRSRLDHVLGVKIIPSDPLEL